MLKFLKRHKETLLITLLGLLIFGALNWMMTQWHPDRWTNVNFGGWTAFHKFMVSGFDYFTYAVITDWRPMYDLYRHPLLALMLWPLSELNKWLKDYTDINCAIYIVAVVWTLLSTCAWCLLYRIIRSLIGLRWQQSLLLTLFFFGFSHVKLVNYVEDHMLLTMTLLLFTLYLLEKNSQKNKILSWWKMMPLYFVGTGITTTNSVKIWLMDMVGMYNKSLTWKRNIPVLFKRSLWFFIPTLIIGGIYMWELDNTQREEAEHTKNMVQTRLRTDSAFRAHYAENQAASQKHGRLLKSKQLTDCQYLEWTDNTIDRLPLLWENIFGEGIILHEESLLKDANISENPRPVFVEYSHWWDHAVESIIIILFTVGLWFGRKKHLLWMCMLPVLFDAMLHVGLRFAASDVYIMTAHWAFIIPIAVGFMMKGIEKRARIVRFSLTCVIACVTVFLWWHNVALIYSYILG